MIRDYHQIAYLEFRIHTTRCIGNKESLDAKLIHYTYGEGGLFHGIAFIEMESALHGHDIHSPKFSENKFSTMPFYCRNGKVWYIAISENITISYF